MGVGKLFKTETLLKRQEWMGINNVNSGDGGGTTTLQWEGDKSGDFSPVRNIGKGQK